MSQTDTQRVQRAKAGMVRKETPLKLVTHGRQMLDHSGTQLLEPLLAGGATKFEIEESETILNSAGMPVSSDASLSRLLAKANILVWTADPESSDFTYVSKQAEEILGYAVADWYEPGFWSAHLHPEDQQQIFPAGLKPFSFADHSDCTFRMLASDGQVVWLHCLVNVTPLDHQARQITGLMIDITEQQRTQEVLTYLGGRLIEAQEKERSRISRELHDDFNQRMALLSIELEQVGREIQEPNNRELFEKVQGQVKEISTDIHRLSYRLHPSKLDHLGLAAAVKSLCEEYSDNAKVHIAFHRSGSTAPLAKDLELCLFRVAQEALRNCVRHSGAKSIEVELARSKEAIRLRVSDNGCGFDTNSDRMQSGLGFISMRERLHIVGGELQVHSQPLRGTRVEVSVPLVSTL
ncbi:MAG TPA: ATP-binding protein [Pyrinomonadaceae bacterium]|nr:ATP-binding protein [Pyrinomonadaceae bacterium]